MTEKKLKDTVFLPKTSFPMQGRLAENDPKTIGRWQEENLYKKLREKSKNKKKFILHSGPPYANGHLHMGHAFNGILKDVINKCYQMSGYDAPLVMGWDCHGLPIEWKIEEEYLKAGKKREEVPVAEFLGRCREYASEWLETQKDGFRDLGIIFDYDNPYCTMTKENETTIYEEFLKILKAGYVYRDNKPVMWSVVEKTALAEAELEYHDKTSDAIYVRFPIVKTNNELLNKAYAVIWTTTPWTIPANKAIAYNPEFKYSLLKANNANLVVSSDLVKSFVDANKISDYAVIAEFSASEFAGTICEHPLKNLGFDVEVPLLPADYVTADAGTGLVHTAPGHGLDDFNLGKQFGLSTECSVNEDGTLKDNLPYFKGEHVFKVNPKVIDELQKSGNLVGSSKIVHSYPHSWRSKAPLIFRTTTQWFIDIEPIREKLIEETKKTKWYPASFINRILGMIEKRPNWCISRQRLWGVPIALFVNKTTNEVLKDDEVFNRIINTFRSEGIEAWRTRPAQYFLGNRYNTEDFEQIKDTIEVWFDSGCTHKYVTALREDLNNSSDKPAQADLYLEGSDQHRGWFQSSLIESVLTNGYAPYKRVATHGFLVDGEGRKMSKSLGNVVAPTDITSKYGADILRLWVVSGDYSEDMRIGDEIIKRQLDIYRRYRNTLRYLLGVLSDYDGDVEYEELPLIEKFVLHRLRELDELLKKSVTEFNLQKFYSELHTFCTNDLSAFYFDIRKDCMYCSAKSDITRRSALCVMSKIFDCLVHWLAPVLSFTAEEAWIHYGNDESIHLESFPTLPKTWANDNVNRKIQVIQSVRSVVLNSLETERTAKTIGSSLEAEAILYTQDSEVFNRLKELINEELFGVSSIKVIQAQSPSNAITDDATKVGVVVIKAPGHKCDRCWKVKTTVAESSTDFGNVNLCERCKSVVCE